MKKLRTAAFIFSALILCFIWVHSALPRDVSKAESLGVGRFVTPFLELFVGEGNVTDHLVRKIAHFTEYFAFGISLETLLFTYSKRPYIAEMCAFSAAFIDETIQIFSDRGPMISDVWLDVFGATAGIAAAGAVLYLKFLKKRKD